MIRPIQLAPLLLIALPLGACTKAEQQSADSVLSVFGLTTSVPPAQSFSSEVGMEEDLMTPEPVECIVPALMFRTHQCDEATGQIIPIR